MREESKTMDPWETVEQRYHQIVTVGYSFVIGVIALVLRMAAIERIVLWVLGVLLFSTVLRAIRKGAEPAPKFEV